MATMSSSVNYRKLKNEELYGLFVLLQAKFNKGSNSRQFEEYQDYVKKYFPTNAAVMVIGVNSEYNDNTYDNNMAYVQVLDSNGREILPFSGKEREARKEALSLSLGERGETEDPVEDIVIPVGTNLKIEDLFVKE